MTATELGYAERYREWIARARPFFAAGNTKEAFVGFPYLVNEEVPFTPLPKPLAELTIFPVTSGGIYLPASQPPFDEPNHEGDASYRLLPTRLEQAAIDVKHGHYNPAEALQDYNTVFPIDRLRELADEGKFGRLTDVGVSFMGYITDADVVAQELAPAIVREALAAGAEAAFLVPVWPICHQSVGLIARAMEAAGIPTVSLAIFRGHMLRVKPPRTLLTRFPRGQTLGPAGDRATQRVVTMAALELLASATEGGVIGEFGAGGESA